MMALTRWKYGDREIIVSHKADALTVSLTEQNLVSYDHAGRYLGSYDRGTNIRRGLDNIFQRRWRDGGKTGPTLRQRSLRDDEARVHLEDLRAQVGRLLEDRTAAAAHPATKEVLQRAVDYSYDRLASSARDFSQLYGHIPILPPDQYRALVVQATDGCTYNKCTFCTLYRDKTFHVRTPGEFREHIRLVLDFMGEGLSYRTSLFLGDANAIAITTARLFELVNILHETPALQKALKHGGIHAFMDIYTGTRKTVDDYRKLKELGLRRVSLGVESGDEALLTFVQKPGSRQNVYDVVHSLKAAGVAVVIIFMVGLGGHDFREKHLNESASLAQLLPLSKGDIIYLSAFSPNPQAPYLPLAAEIGLRAMTVDEINTEMQEWKKVLGDTIHGTGAKVVPYSFQRFIY
ncbi:MAG: radical SAM protein [Fidelibacterota bacterium]|nr:MAG: radical SAM protein [Candidatus Neomarinimicrobiota bacterium]